MCLGWVAIVLRGKWVDGLHLPICNPNPNSTQELESGIRLGFVLERIRVVAGKN